MKKAKRWVSLMMVMVLVFLASACGKSEEGSNQKFVLKFNHVLAESEPFHQGFLNWAQAVKERTNGNLEIQVFPSAQLGVEEDIIEQLKQGVNVGQNTDSARLGMYVPDIAVMNAPYFAETIEDVEKLNDSPTVKQWLKDLEDQHDIKVLSFNWIQGLRHMVTNKPVKSPADLQGLRIRTPGVPVWQESVRSLGAAPVALPFGEVYIGIQQGAIDGAELVYRNVTGGKLYEAAKYVSETSHIMLINFQVVGKKFFDSLPKEYQDILIEECNKAGLEISKKMEQETEQLKKEIAAHGVTIIPANEIDIAAFKKAGEAAYTKLNLVQARDTVFKEMGK
ncbi:MULTISPECIES: C4-dicarboxylate TRAP transporter substrate-binding protein [Paenibacillus]|uniref:Sialic acid-binding periplasmic protein SiaP n=1 Tax=Paenibacillus naphthalenovorans TaxID=162209 RepID=A0A0U2W3B7_9BACL|nr:MULTISPECIES: C4-dicarboxylate TRAP transporter substrate-binding protein [Paenibacillus]ALS23044.1 sialic acid-binding periplasmic protein SiaP [Paenibacillus naphthalenovorans]GCL71895.1 C4-dicarboxylate ABC transporter [Paenibacillus naphthalenovorans]SDI41863.1 tripartite ATP-independent transporter solute receptor, DctP family [Paenibacillus naphthalenovorans]